MTELLRRYTNIPALIYLLTARKITLLDPASWDDKNDLHFLSLYREKKSLETVLAFALHANLRNVSSLARIRGWFERHLHHIRQGKAGVRDAETCRRDRQGGSLSQADRDPEQEVEGRRPSLPEAIPEWGRTAYSASSTS